MSMQDLISDYVARINNSIMVKKPEIKVIKSNVIISITKKLTSTGYISSFTEDGNYFIVRPNFFRVNKLTRISKPGQRIYCSYKNLPKVVGGKGFNIISSPKGILRSDEAKKEKQGGELLFSIY